MSRNPDPELDGIFNRDREAGRYLDLLRRAKLKPPPLDPAFRLALRRKLMAEAYKRYERRSRPGLLAGLFTGPRFAFASAAVGALLIAVVFAMFANGNLFAAGPVQVTTIGGSQMVDKPILVKFSQPMDHQSVQQSIQIEPATQVTYQWQGNNLVIQPASGQLAPNTQYHVTVAKDAKTADAKPLGQDATIAITTVPLPVTPPSPRPSPTAKPVPAITSERNLAPSGTPVAWSPDGATLYYLAGGDLDSIRRDGTGQKTLLAVGVTAAALATDGSKVLVLQAGRLFLLTPTTGVSEAVGAAPSAVGVGFLGAKSIYWTGLPGPVTFLNIADAQPIATTPGGVHGLYLSPDGSRAVLTPNPAVAGGQPSLFDLASKTSRPWNLSTGSNVAWSPDSSKVAFLAAGSVLVGLPDGTGTKPVLDVADPVAEISWTPADKLLVVSNSGTWLVNPDGNDLRKVRPTSVGSGPIWAPGGGRVALVRDSALWEIEIESRPEGFLDLNVGGTVVDRYEKARIEGKASTAGSYLTASAARTAPTPPADGVRLNRYFVISSQVTPDSLVYIVRLIFSKGTDEIRYQDEALTLVTSDTTLRIDSVVDSQAHELRHGPTVISVQQRADGLLLVFDSDLQESTVAANVHLTAGGKPVTATTAYASRRLTVTASLAPEHAFTLVVSTGLLDISGQPLQSDYSYAFVTP